MNSWSDKISEVIARVEHDKFSYLGKDALFELAEAVHQIETEKTEGILIEAGCALGGSAITAASVKAVEKGFYIYDVFGMIPPPSDKDGNDVRERYQVIVDGNSAGIGGDEYYGYKPDLYNTVIENFASFNLKIEENNIYLVKGLYEDTLSVDIPVAFAHIDCDWYDSVMICLQRIEPHLVKNGVLIIDDYFHWSGCKIAVDQYFADKKDQFIFIHKNRLHIKKR